MKKLILVFLFWASALTAATAQEIIVTGQVLDETGQPLPSVSVVLKGTSIGTVTDVDGNYKVSAPGDATLVFSFIGYITKEVSVGNRAVVNVEMSPDSKLLDEVVVVGYGTQKKSDLTGSVASIGGEDLQKSVFANLDQALKGRLAGVQVTQNSGAPGSAASIRIRGTSSITGSNEPLYVIDGIQFQGGAGSISGFDFAGGAGGQTAIASPLSQISPNDIESIEVLKDASATAIYGSRAANGVVIITTKRGKSGDSKVSYNGYYGVQEVPTKIDMMELPEYAEYQVELTSQLEGRTVNERFLDPSLLSSGTDWQDEVFEAAPMQSHQVTFSGGSDNVQYALMGGYFEQDGIIIGSGFERFTARLNLDSQVKEYIKVGASISFADISEKITLNDGGDGVISQAMQMPPSVPVRDMDGNLAGPTEGTADISANPVGLALLRNNTLARQSINANFYANINLYEGLTFNTEFALSNGHALSKAFMPTYTWGTITNPTSQLKQREENNFFWIFKNFLTYNTDFGVHNIKAMIGTEAQRSQWNGSEVYKINFATNDIPVLSQGENSDIPTNGWDGASTLASYFGRLNYNFDDRYLLTFTLRADGSSKFGPNNKWGYFPSAALKWRVANESFFPESDVLSDFGIRAGYGQTGNQEIGNYAYGSSLRSLNSAFGTAYINNRIANPDVKWESTEQINLGIDLSLLSGRLDITADVYKKYTEDMLLEVAIPNYLGGGEGGIGAPYANVGSMENEGIEVAVNTRNIVKSDFTWSTDLNFTANRNNITELDRAYYQNLYWYAGFDDVTRTYVGNPVGMFYGYEMEGIFTSVEEIENHAVQVEQDGSVNEDNPHGVNYIHERDGMWPGDVKFRDVNNDGVIDSNDKTIIGDPNPDFSFGFNNNFTYKNFELTVYVVGVQGYDIFNFTKVRNERMDNVYNNQSVNVQNRARVELNDLGQPYVTNPETDFPRFSQLDVNENDRMSSRWIEDGSYIRLQNIRLSYTLPQDLTERFNVQRLGIYVNAQNVYTFTDYSGYDPEIGAFNQNALRQNIDMGRYPAPRIYTIGLDLTL